MSKKSVLWILALALILTACGGSTTITAEVVYITDYDPGKDQIVKVFKVADEGQYVVYRQQGFYNAEISGPPSAVYITYFWLKAGETTPPCPDEFAGFPRYSCDLTRLGFTDLIPPYIKYNTTMFYGSDLDSADTSMSVSTTLTVNTMPTECAPQDQSGQSLQDCTVELIVPRP